MAKVAISLPDELLAQLDAIAGERQQTRSSLIREWLGAQLAQEEHERIRAEWKAIYDEIAEDEIAMSEELLAISIFPTLEPYGQTVEEAHELSPAG